MPGRNVTCLIKELYELCKPHVAEQVVEGALKFTQDYDKGRGDEHLVRMAIEGDQDALETVFTQYRDHLYYTALRLCGNPEDAEDALQDGLLSAFRHLRHFQGRPHFSTGLTRVAHTAPLIPTRHPAN